jgi:S-adenosylmethionine hydrolase
MPYNWISLTTDYGLDDGFVAACHGVIATIAPAVRVIDVSHTVPPQDIRRAGAVLQATLPYLPPAVHLVVVDPGVGTARRPIVVRTSADELLVGPDNGLLPLVADARGGVTAAHELSAPEYRLPMVSATFHGRDVFAPAAAHLALGVAPAELGQELAVDSLVRLAPPVDTSIEIGSITTSVHTVDRFGNIQFDSDQSGLAAAEIGHGELVSCTVSGQAVIATVGHTFGDVPVGQSVLYPDSAGRLALAINGGSAAATLAARTGDPVIVSRVDSEVPY